MANEHADVIVVGAGLIGLLTAQELARGGLSVILVERGRAGREASRAAAGILAPVCPWKAPPELGKLARWSQELYPVLADELRRQTGVDPEWTASGALFFDVEESEAAQAWGAEHGAPVELLAPADLKRWEPALASVQRRAILVPGVAQVHNSRLIRAAKESVLGQGVPLREGVEVTGFLTQGSRVTGVRTSTGTVEAGQTIIAAGAWSGTLLEPIGIKLGIGPERGQIIQYDGPPGLLGRILFGGGAYLVPRRDGKIVAGSTREDVGFDTSTTEEGLATLRAAAEELLPMLNGAAVMRHWAGLRPATPDGLPYIGPCSGTPGLYLNTGHFSHGITLAPASARLLADIVLQRPPIVDPAPFAPGRAR